MFGKRTGQPGAAPAPLRPAPAPAPASAPGGEPVSVFSMQTAAAPMAATTNASAFAYADEDLEPAADAFDRASAPTQPAPADRLDEGWLPKLQATANEISSALGYNQSAPTAG